MANDQLPYPFGGYRNAPGVSPGPVNQTPSQPPPFTPPAGTVAVNTDDLQNAATGFQDISAEVAQISQRLTSTLSGNDAGGSPWGNDPVGQSFGAQYIPARDVALNSLQGLATLLEDISTSLQQSARILQGAED